MDRASADARLFCEISFEMELLLEITLFHVQSTFLNNPTVITIVFESMQGQDTVCVVFKSITHPGQVFRLFR